MSKYVKFTGKWSNLKSFGFQFLKLYSNNIFYTTYEMLDGSSIWIRKSFGIVTFDNTNFTSDSCATILEYLISANFDMDCPFMTYNTSAEQVEVKELEHMFNDEYFSSHRDIYISKNTLAVLKILWNSGQLEIVKE